MTATVLLANVPALAGDIFPTPHKMKLTGGVSRCAEIRCVEDKRIPKDGYAIRITGRRITIRCSSAGGALYARQTLDMLKADGAPRCVIKDYPRCAWRGLMLDSGRQYQRIGTVKEMLDLMFELKMNVFHWHLTEGLGWRLEIRQYPELTSKGACVGDGLEQQGYYTQDEVREIVKYAAERNITVVPEIDIPGHAEAALFSYPEYGCFGEPASIPETGFTDCIFCAGKDATLDFLKNVLDEVCDLFPSDYIHLGGDEAPKGNWDRCPDCQSRIEELGLKDSHELQLWLSEQMALYLKSKGRKAIFWEDVIGAAEYPLPDNVVIQWWNYRRNRDANYRKAIEKGHQVICSPNYYTYLNFPETPWRGYGKDRTFSLEDAYMRNPADTALSENNPLTLGMECALWTDYGLTEDMLEDRLFPRIYSLAELMWRGRALPFEEISDRIITLEQ